MHGRYYAGRMLNVEFCSIAWNSAVCGRSHKHPEHFFACPAHVTKELPDKWIGRLSVSFQIFQSTDKSGFFLEKYV